MVKIFLKQQEIVQIYEKSNFIQMNDDNQSMTELLRFGPFNGHKVVILFVDFRRSPLQIPVSPELSPPYPCVTHTAHYYIGCGNHRQFILNRRSNAELLSRILLRLIHRCLIGSMSLRHK